MDLSGSLGISEPLVAVGIQAKDFMAVLSLCTLRMYVAFFVSPITDDQLISGPLRNGMCFVLGSFIALGQPAHAFADWSLPMMATMLFKEALIGLLLGFSFSIVSWIAQGVGAMIDNSAGFNNAQMSNPLNGEQSTPVSNLLGQVVISGFYMLGGMMVCVGLIFESFRWWPLAEVLPTVGAGLIDFLTFQVDSYFTAVVKISAPIMLVLVLVDLGFGLLSKTAEKLEASNLSQPVKGLVATIMFALLVSLFFEQAKPEVSMMNLQQVLQRWVGGKTLGQE